jgi:hypothetical protein
MHKIRNFYKGHSTVGEWQGNGRVVAGERHGTCESASMVAPSTSSDSTAEGNKYHRYINQ